jgi:K(+)-stimulated pyrophosphate-energized sodium pump
VGTANRIAVPLPKTTCTVSGNVNIPENGAAARLLAFVRNPESNTNAWFSMDQIAFDSGSATLRPESQAQLDNIATVLSSCPSIHLDIAGFTDNVGSADSNLRLSQKRAGSVVAQLVNKGIPRNRLTAEGLRRRGRHRRQFHGAGPRPESARRHACHATVST